jgi:hypothetical protein
VPPEVLAALVLQLPLVAVVAYGFLSRRVRSAGEIEDVRRAAQDERDRLLTAANQEQARLLAQHERELRDKEAAAVAWKQLYERADEERRANGRELAEQLRTLDMALELVRPR